MPKAYTTSFQLEGANEKHHFIIAADNPAIAREALRSWFKNKFMSGLDMEHVELIDEADLILLPNGFVATKMCDPEHPMDIVPMPLPRRL